MLAGSIGFPIELTESTRLCGPPDRGRSALAIVLAARRLGFVSRGFRVDTARLISMEWLPAIAHVHPNHFVLVMSVDANGVDFIDPCYGSRRLAIADFDSRASGIFIRVTAADCLTPRSIIREDAPEEAQ